MDKIKERNRFFAGYAKNRITSAFYIFVGNVTNIALLLMQALLLPPLLLKSVNPELYAFWIAGMDLMIWASSSISYGVPHIMAQHIGIAYSKKDFRAIGEHFTAGMALILLLALLFILAAYYATQGIHYGMTVNETDSHLLGKAFFLCCVSIGLTTIFNGTEMFLVSIQQSLFIKFWGSFSFLVGLITSLLCIKLGYGILAIPFGMLARAVVALSAGVFLAVRCVLRDYSQNIFFCKNRFWKMAKQSVGSMCILFSHEALNAGDNFLAMSFFGPEIVLLLSFTKKAADLVRYIMDSITAASVGVFPHLVGIGDKVKILKGRTEILNVQQWFGLSLLLAYIVWNSQAITLWVGSKYYGGIALTVAIAGATFISARSYLSNSLYKFTGPVMRSSIIAVIELLLKFTFVFLLAPVIGVTGLPTATIMACFVFFGVANYLTRKEIGFLNRTKRTVIFNKYTILYLTFFLLSLGYSWWAWHHGSWFGLISGGIMSVSFVGISILLYDIHLVRYKIKLASIFKWPQKNI